MKIAEPELESPEGTSVNCQGRKPLEMTQIRAQAPSGRQNGGW